VPSREGEKITQAPQARTPGSEALLAYVIAESEPGDTWQIHSSVVDDPLGVVCLNPVAFPEKTV
jgi:hypothetical protein